jgi:hypothetical protein
MDPIGNPYTPTVLLNAFEDRTEWVRLGNHGGEGMREHHWERRRRRTFGPIDRRQVLQE